MNLSAIFASLLGLSLSLFTTGVYRYYSKPKIHKTMRVVILNPDKVSEREIPPTLPEDLGRIANSLEQELVSKLRKDQQKKAISLIKISLIGIIISLIGLILGQ
ncbi:hypothetical protein PFDSM3638_05485 [Pyrococcus furiosus DSM 3638]|uniref:Uncharacterized protein n=3 Tax=Pyrococcus furiosus TaxID=2261 RepID=A0A5C0XPZ5_PYRFU|nr:MULTISPECIES: hypothetical protein [Pyrococcus]AAL81219.1 hypothetical protein PF1095 [Pyrococcus furiosus DSM 3638]AFN03887.1 hypothetical protein PFC_04700 [Pyrococcus furiosus COM1]MDK2868783.1 hypothetical protein [Pyrococcus sp.]QEK78751.1 hypothetical protein PFDSM3638_05485 [Pyrococcus furiosus DSM 3638]